MRNDTTLRVDQAPVDLDCIRTEVHQLSQRRSITNEIVDRHRDAGHAHLVDTQAGQLAPTRPVEETPSISPFGLARTSLLYRVDECSLFIQLPHAGQRRTTGRVSAGPVRGNFSKSAGHSPIATMAARTTVAEVEQLSSQAGSTRTTSACMESSSSASCR
jgi:hypothetical protein